MKKPETPRTDASAKPVDSKKTTGTISVDSKGTASPAPNKPEKATSSPATDKSASDSAKASGTANSAAATNTPAAAKPDVKPAAAGSTAQAGSKPGNAGTAGNADADKTDPKAARKATPPTKGSGGKALVLFVLIIAGALAIGWITRAVWWRDAEPVLSQFFPDEMLAEIAPEGFESSAPVVASNNPAETPGSDQNSLIPAPATTTESAPAPNENATMAEKDDAMVNLESTLPPVTGTSEKIANADPLPDGSVVIDPELTERLSRLEGTIDALRERLNNERGDTLNNTVARRMAEIETRTAPIEELARVESELAGVANEMRELSARLSTMEEEVRATAGLRVESRGQAIAMAVTILRDALQRGGPFVIALNQLERSNDNDPLITEQINILKPLAEQGAPTVERLRQSFPAMAQEAVLAATDDHSGSVLDATWANIKKLVPVRRVDAAGEESLEGRLVLAEKSLEQDDLDGAIAALEGIEGTHASAAVADWLAAARNRQILNGAIATLSSHAIGLLTGAEDSQ